MGPLCTVKRSLPVSQKCSNKARRKSAQGAHISFRKLRPFFKRNDDMTALLHLWWKLTILLITLLESHTNWTLYWYGKLHKFILKEWNERFIFLDIQCNEKCYLSTWQHNDISINGLLVCWCLEIYFKIGKLRF